jgi:pimeloyl-ACP methyl ester carboxylesterase
MWVSRHPLNNSLAVFLHGLWGSRWGTWKSHVDFFQGIYERSPVLSSYDIYLFNYATALRQPPLYPDVMEELRAFVDQTAARYNTIVLVCHSQGGLLGKRYILHELIAGRGTTMKVDRIVTLNTPHRGGRLYLHPVLYTAQALNLLSRVWRGLFLRQMAELTRTSENVKFLKHNWGPQFISPVPVKATDHRRFIRSVTLASSRDLFVSKKSAQGFEIDSPDYGSASHAADSSEMADYVGKCLSEHEDPLALQKEIDSIYQEPVARMRHSQACEATAQRLIQALGKPISSRYLSAKPTSLSEDFREAFVRHPLRKLSLREAFATYVQKVLSD